MKKIAKVLFLFLFSVVVFSGTIGAFRLLPKNQVTAVNQENNEIVNEYQSDNSNEIEKNDSNETGNNETEKDVNKDNIGTIITTSPEYKVEFMVDNEVVCTRIILENMCVLVPDSPSIDGYMFIGWSLNGTDVVSDIDNIPVLSDTTYYAVFVIEVPEEDSTNKGNIEDLPEESAGDLGRY